MTTWDQLAYIGAGVAIVVAALLAAAVVILIIAAWQMYGPRFLCRKPETEIILSTYRSDVRDGEGQRVKCSGDLRIGRLIGVSWRLRFFAGIMLLREDRP